ncbi:MAG: MaoC family dehydratase [Rhodocyclaceae bacterium]|nr:MAG: MaoC family dehydratase [Rhodocyclaceae bacterium]
MTRSVGFSAEELAPGMSASFSKTITEADIIMFTGVSGDINAVHLDEVYAASTSFGGRIAHGMLSAGLISAALANRLPGPGTIYLAQSLFFRAPVRPGDTVTATVTVKSVITEKRRVILETICRVGDIVVIDGEATMLAPKRPPDSTVAAPSTQPIAQP